MTDDALGRTAKLNVLFVLSSLGRAGAQRQLILTAAGLRDFGHAVTIMTLRGPADLDGAARAGGAAVVNLGHNGRFGGLLGRVRYVGAARRFRADAVYSFMPAANVTAALVGRWTTHRCLIWGIRDSGTDLAPTSLKARIVSRLADRLATRPDRIIANSHAALQHYTARGYPRDRFVVIPNGIDVDRFRPDEGRRARERKLHGFDDDDFVAVCVGRIDPMKGHAGLLQACARASVDGAHLRLWVVGAHTELWAREFLRSADRLGVVDRVHLDQAVDDPVGVYNAADVVVSASGYGEGFSNVVGEALACGRRVIVTDVGDSARVVGEHGVVVPAGDIDALAEAIGSVAHARDVTEDREARRRHIVDHYSIERLCRRTEATLLEALGERERS